MCGSIRPVLPDTPLPANGSGTITGAAQTNTYCNPDYNSYPFTGSFIQFFSGFDPEKVDCLYNTNPTELSPATGLPWPTIPNLCATNQCELLAPGSPSYTDVSLIDVSNPKTGGIRFVSLGATPIHGDDFTCRVDPNTGFPRARRVIHSLYCNTKGKKTDALVINQAWNDGDCTYNIVLSHRLGCAI